MVTKKSTGETLTPDGHLYFGASTIDDHFSIDGQPQLDIIEFSDWNLITIRVPEYSDGKSVHTVFLYYLDDSTVQVLGFNRYSPQIPADSEIKADMETDSFTIDELDNGTVRYTVEYDQYQSHFPYCLRLADECPPENITFNQNTKFGEVSFSYNVYSQSDDSLKISSHNFVETSSDSIEVLSDVYQPAMSIDGLAQICAPIEFEIIELSDCGIAAVRVPLYRNDKMLHIVSMYYFDETKLQLLGDGYFFPEIPADSEIISDNDCFSLTDEFGVVHRYSVCADSKDEQHMLVQSCDD